MFELPDLPVLDQIGEAVTGFSENKTVRKIEGLSDVISSFGQILPDSLGGKQMNNVQAATKAAEGLPDIIVGFSKDHKLSPKGAGELAAAATAYFARDKLEAMGLPGPVAGALTSAMEGLTEKLVEAGVGFAEKGLASAGPSTKPTPLPRQKVGAAGFNA